MEKIFFNATKTQCAIHWSVLLISMPDRPQFQSLLPGYRTSDSQIFQLTNKPRSESLFRHNFIENSDPKIS